MRMQREPDKKLAMEGEEKGGEIYSLKANGRIRNWPLPPFFLQQHIDSRDNNIVHVKTLLACPAAVSQGLRWTSLP